MLLTFPLLDAPALERAGALCARAPWPAGDSAAGGTQLPRDSAEARALATLLLQALETSPTFLSAALPARVFPPRFNRHGGRDNHYPPHLDTAVRFADAGLRVRTDLSCTVFLDDPASYEGGELVLHQPGGQRLVKMPAGHAALYPASWAHELKPVTRGWRHAGFLWVQSLVRGEEQRRLLLEFDQALTQLRQQGGDNPATVALTGTYHNLMRLWAEPEPPAHPMDVQPLPPDLRRLADHERHARAALDGAAWDYLCGAAGEGVTERANREAWASVRLLPRVLAPLAGLDTSTTLLGHRMAWPLLVAPLAHQQLAHRDGEVGIAMAAAAQEAGMVLSMQAGAPMETVASAVRADAGRGPLWFQLAWHADRGAVEALAQRAAECGYEALVLTVDSPVRSGFRLPAGLPTPNLPAATPPGDFAALCAAAPTWDDVAWLASRSRLPVILKGVLHPRDARLAAERGAAAIIVSNHGGRALDGAAATAAALPAIAEAVRGKVPLLVDGGIRHGADILKALALGADAVLVGRPAVWGLAHSGALGVAHALRLLRDELQVAMAQCGCASLAAIREEPLLFPNQSPLP